MPDPLFRLFASISAPDDPAAETAIAAGVDGVLVAIGSVFGDLARIDPLVERCRTRSIAILLDVEMDRFPADHALVQASSALFHIPRREANPALMDPHAPAAAFDARARLRGDEAEGLLGAIADRLVQLARSGIGGLRLVGLETLSGGRASALLARVREEAPDALIFAGPLGDRRDAAAGLHAAGVDGLVSSYGYWNFADGWFYEEVDAIRGRAPIFNEVRVEHLAGADDPDRTTRRLAAAAALGGGMIVPAGLLTPELVAALRRTGLRGVAYRGAIRSLMGTGAPVLAVLRADHADVRLASRAMIVLINRTGGEQPAPAIAGILEAAGVALGPLTSPDATTAPFAPLTGGEVRVLMAGCADQITLGGFTEDARAAAAWPRFVIENVAPSVGGGAFAVKRVVGEQVQVTATIFGDGHEQLAAEIRWRAADETGWSRTRMVSGENDRWSGSFPLMRLGRHEFVIETWLDRFGGFRRDFAKKLAAGVAQPIDHVEGRALVEDAARRNTAFAEWLQRLAGADPEESARLLLSPELAAAMDTADDRPQPVSVAPQIVDAERLQARFSSWYELFPRSMSGTKARHGTFADVIDHLPRIRDMGFDTLYFPPIHPIGTANRKGPNNTLTPAPGDPGSPYAIGSTDGGHDAIHPELGSFEDFARLVAAAHDHGLEIAIDFAIQCSPDHPWLKEHPGWFAWRPDGSMKYAENPPKKYQDIVNVDFYAAEAVPDLWLALRDVVLLWVRNGVRTFRVDNPHTKPLPFWEWMIGEVRRRHPEVIFLAEAFTRPGMMYRLAKVGFSQSYTYFTWRDDKASLTDYIEELTTTAPREFYRPHFFVNTPDINPYFLQTSGRAGFRIRAVLAATLSGLFGVYSGFELCEAAALPGREEYLDSEKYELRPRDWASPGNIVADITLLNRLRRAHPALQTHLNTRFYRAGNDRVIYYGKREPDGPGMILVLASLDPHGVQETEFDVPLWALGLADDGSVAVEDLAGGYRFDWHGRRQTIRLDPDEPYRIWRIAPHGGAA